MKRVLRILRYCILVERSALRTVIVPLTVLALSLPFWLGFTQAAAGTGWTVGAGSTVDLGDGHVDLACGDMEIEASATLVGGNSELELAGSWIGDGLFLAGTSLVTFKDGCPPLVSTISNQNGFFDLALTTSSGKEIRIEAGSTQAVSNSLIATGSAGNLLKIRSTADGLEGFLDLQAGGTQLVDHVDVKDNHAIGQHLAPGLPGEFNSVDSGNSDGWFLVIVEIPTISAAGLAMLALLLLAAAYTTLRRITKVQNEC